MFKSAVLILVTALLLACGGTDMRGEADAAGDMEELGDVPGDVVPDGDDALGDADGVGPDVAMDTTGDPDAVEDVAGEADVIPDTVTDPDVAGDMVDDPDVAMDTLVDPDVTMDTVVDPDVTGDAVDDPDVSMDTMVDPDVAVDTVDDPDVTGDTMVDPDVAVDTVFDPDVTVDTSIDPGDAGDVTGEDPGGPEVTDVFPDSTCGGTPFIRSVRKGSEFTTGCNPDGSTTEELAATAIGGCCVSLDHYCTWLNCCARFVASLRHLTTPMNLEISESEIGPFCMCEGWYSPSYEICGLTPGTWTIWIGSLSVTVVVS